MPFHKREQRDAEWFDGDYFNRGTETGKSLYTNYHYIPERMHREANALLSFLNESGFEIKPNYKIVDFGCAMGYFVTELLARELDAYGVDISEYAVTHADAGAHHRINLVKPITAGTKVIYPYWKTLAEFDFSVADLVIARDVMEHMDEATLDETLHVLGLCSTYMFVGVPLGSQEHGFFINEMNWDTSHILPRTSAWWYERFISAGWHVKSHTNRIPGMKANWEASPYGFHFFLLASYSVPAHRK